MTGPERSLDRLERIVETIRAIQRHLGKLTKVQFEEESDDIDLLAFRLSQIGEMTNRLWDTAESELATLLTACEAEIRLLDQA